MLEKGCILLFENRQYEVIDVLGRGANTTAYLASCTQDGLVTRCILKEFSPRNTDDFEKGKSRFIASGRTQNSIRQRATLTNQTPPVSRIFEANGTAYIDVACYNGTTLDRSGKLSLSQYMAICRTISKTVGYYHKSGYLCLDLKPENIFILQNSPDDTVTQLVEFIDFDSVREAESAGNSPVSYTRDWAAPEQLNPYESANISTSADIYTVGELVFFLLFGRHSTEAEHRVFSRYPFEDCVFRKPAERPDIQRLFIRLFRGTIRSSAANRFQNIDEVTKLLDELVDLLEQKEFVIPSLPVISPEFVGREEELRQMSDVLEGSPVLYLTGVGGIGKTTLVRNFIARNRGEYDVIVYLESDGDLKHTFCDDMQLQISTVSRQDGEPLGQYFSRKMRAFKRICGERKVLFALDNFSGPVTKELSRLLDCGFRTIITSRRKPPKNSFAVLEVGAIETEELFRLIAIDLERTLTKEERLYFVEIIGLVQGHTLVLELIARQIAAGKLEVRRALELIRQQGFSSFSGEIIGSYKDGEEIYDTLSAIISALFVESAVSHEAGLALKTLAMLNVRGLERSLAEKFFPDIQPETLSQLAAEGWLYDGERIRLHPVIAETVRNWQWQADDVNVMALHKKAVDIYVGMSDDVQLRAILREAELFREQHPRHIITAMYYDMLSCLYDVELNGAYYPENEHEAQLLQKELDAMDRAIAEMEQSSDSRKSTLLTQYYLSLASILIRSYPDYYDEAAELLDRASELVENGSDNHCYYCMVSAWYYTLAEPDIAKMRHFTELAQQIAMSVFPTELEIIDIIHIPTANCFFYHCDFLSAAKKIEEAAEICRIHSEMLPYIDKLAELLLILVDIYSEMQDKAKCRELIAEIDQLNEAYKEQGVYREVSPEKRAKAGI